MDPGGDHHVEVLLQVSLLAHLAPPVVSVSSDGYVGHLYDH